MGQGTPRCVEEFLAQKKVEASDWTARKYYGALSAAFNRAVKTGLMDKNPCEEIKKPTAAPRPPCFLSREDARRLFEVIADDHFRGLCLFALNTGLRLGEMISLRWDAVDLQRRAIVVQNTESFTTKSKRNRIVPLNDTACSILVTKSRAQRVFLRKDGSPWNESYVGHLFKKCVRTSGVDKRLHFHSLRHTFASWLVQDGVSIFEVQKLLGHSNIAITQEYSHLQPEQRHSTVNRILFR